MFEGELSTWVEGVGNVDINDKDGIVDGAVSESLGGIVLVIGIPIWRCIHATSEDNSVK